MEFSLNPLVGENFHIFHFAHFKHGNILCRCSFRHGLHRSGRFSVFLHSTITETTEASKTTEPAALLRVHRERGGGLPQHPARGGEAGPDHLQHLGHQVQNTRSWRESAASAGSGVLPSVSLNLLLSALSITVQNYLLSLDIFLTVITLHRPSKESRDEFSFYDKLFWAGKTLLNSKNIPALPDWSNSLHHHT